VEFVLTTCPFILQLVQAKLKKRVALAYYVAFVSAKLKEAQKRYSIDREALAVFWSETIYKGPLGLYKNESDSEIVRGEDV
jgi:hypothetical protein